MIFQFSEGKPIIAVTGSAGKTMVKSMISAILREKWVIFESKDYYNTTDKTKIHRNEISFIHRAVVLEYGMGYAGVITQHCEIIQPNIGVITNVDLAHIVNFDGKVENIAAAKSELIKGMHPNGKLFINADDPNSKMLHIQSFKGHIFSVGIESDADYRAKDLETTPKGISFTAVVDGNEFPCFMPVFGRHNVINALFAIGVAHQLNFQPAEIKNGLLSLRRPYHRLQIHRLRDGITVIDDTVHAHPIAMRAAVDVLVELGRGKKIAILGSMFGLGNLTDSEHEALGKYVTNITIDLLYTYGNISSLISKAAREAGFPKDKLKHFTSSDRDQLHEELIQNIKPKTTVLVKGASRLNMSLFVDYLCDYYKP